MSEKPVHPRPRRLADWINPTGAKKVHSLIDKVYKRKNLEMAWDCVEANRGSGGVDGQSLEAFGQQLGSELNQPILHLNCFWRTLGAALGGMPKLKQIKAVS
jgi:RNA-directed DNA polymerase